MELQHLLRGVLDAQHTELDSAWKDLPDGQELREYVHDVTRELASASVHLASSTESAHSREMWDTLVRDMKNPDISGAIKPYIEVVLADALLPSTDEALRRFLRILRAIVNAQVTPSALSYLKLVSRCYLSQYDSECIVLCRSALEGALRDTINRTSGDAQSVAPPRSLSAKLKYARQEGWLTGDVYSGANEVRLRGNKVVHDDPSVVREVHDTLEKTLAAIAALMVVS